MKKRRLASTISSIFVLFFVMNVLGNEKGKILYLKEEGSVANAQAIRPWVLRAEVGWYDIHVGTPDGMTLAGHVGRRFTSHILWEIGLTYGAGDDDFTALEVGPEFQLLPAIRLNPFVAGGVGLMLEHGSLSSPRYIAGGLEFRVLSNNYVRATVRRANHVSFGDTGTFRGPHLVSVGWVWRL